MSTPVQNADSGKPADNLLPGFYFPTDADGNVLPLLSGGRPTSTLPGCEIGPADMDLSKPKVMTKRTVFVPADADLKVSHISPFSASIQQDRLVGAQSAVSPRLALTGALQQPEPPHQAPLFPCDAAGAVLPLFHPSTSTSASAQQDRLVGAPSAPSSHLTLTGAPQQPEPLHQAPLFLCDAAGAVLPLFHPSTTTTSSPRSRSTTATMSSDNSHTSLPCNASGAVLGLSGQLTTAGSSASVPVVAVGGCDEGEEEEEEEEEDSADSVIEWIDEMLSECRVVEEGFGRRERRRGGGRDAREVLEWLEELRLEV